MQPGFTTLTALIRLLVNSQVVGFQDKSDASWSTRERTVVPVMAPQHYFLSPGSDITIQKTSVVVAFS
ncbi:hypothetical protein BSZ19_15515 [Bradyrhizobium japonicum]|uniref:Uncharacterized protein n=1 Tax=Bradyrhizobium japonicum TaxID=375 RepID=A0A1Y2JQ88_BRAJP|nr:hypothetical protein BSZ19_15515 [Bradyrhizobium japonicum]